MTASFHNWLLAARPKTLVAAVVPVLVGAALASRTVEIAAPILLCTLLSALCIQIGTNLANDYSDFKKGTDNAQRIGPVRVTQAGMIAPKNVKRGAIIAFALAAALGIPLILRGGWPILIIGLLSLLCGWAYTAGPFPLAYKGLGELFVLLFFGGAATAGTCYVLALAWNPYSLLLAFAPGLHACALLAVNNVRDLESDRAAGKLTLAARFGRRFARVEYAMFLLLPFAVPVLLYIMMPLTPAVMLPLLTLPLTILPIKLVASHDDGPNLIRALGGTARVQIFFGLLLAVGIVL
jgi:1,4-dihydroxy-2-naphthoate polyprenyltransferase